MTEETWDVVIVGNGLSGLSAAQTLRKRNGKFRIYILEGKDRGRTVSQELPAAHGIDRWDMGGQWVGSTQTYVMDLIQEFDLEVYTQNTTGKKVHHVGGPHAKVRTCCTCIPALSPLVLLDLSQLVWKIDRLSATVSVEDPMKTPNVQELDNITLHSYIEKQKGGTQQLSERLAQQIGRESVRLGQAVTAIWQVPWKLPRPRKLGMDRPWHKADLGMEQGSD